MDPDDQPEGDDSDGDDDGDVSIESMHVIVALAVACAAIYGIVDFFDRPNHAVDLEPAGQIDP